MEMLIVVILVGIIYSLMLSYFKPRQKSLSLFIASPFRAVLSPYWNHSHVVLLCDHKCKKCTIYDENRTILSKNIEIPFAMADIKDIYQFDNNERIEKAEFLQMEAKKEDEKVCFRYDIYPNRSSTELFIEKKNGKVVYLPPYFNDTKTFPSIEKTRNYFEDLKMDLTK